MNYLDINAKLPIIRAETADDPISINNNNINIINNNGNHKNLPKPSFRPAPNYDYKKRAHTKLNSREYKESRHSYIHYIEPDNDELMKRVEYDMDEEDNEWLKSFNAKYHSKYNYLVTENDFEQIMDRLEKESYFESKKSGKEVVPTVDDDATCAICDDGDCANANVILFCDMCNLAVHQECYGVPYVPEGQWLCRRCLQSPSRNVDCILCPNKGGAFKQTSDNRWCHVICALWVPEVCFANTVFLEPIDNIDQIPTARWRLQCYICKQKKVGACIQCHKSNCYVPFHVTCAQQAGLSMKIQTHRYNTPDGPLTDVIKKAFCDQHGPKDRNGGGGMYSDEETEDEDDPVYRKWRHTQKEKMKKTRKILAEKRQIAFNPISEPTVKEEKLVEIAELLTMRGKKRSEEELGELRREFIGLISGYWLLKRKNRNGVPLLRRLQVSYNSNATKSNGVIDLDKERYERLRYDLEKARLLVGEVKRREMMKKKSFKLSKLIVQKRYEVIDSRQQLNGQSDSSA